MTPSCVFGEERRRSTAVPTEVNQRDLYEKYGQWRVARHPRFAEKASPGMAVAPP